MTNDKIKTELRKGDYQRLAEATGYVKDYVIQVINGKRNNVLILDAAKELIEKRGQLSQKYNRYNQA
jgi:hypothetical protein